MSECLERLGGLLAAVTITNPPRAAPPAGAPPPRDYLNCGLEALPLAAGPSMAVGAKAPSDRSKADY